MNSNRLDDPMQRPQPAQVTSRNCKNSASTSEPICGAKTRAATPCRNMPMRNGRCRMHGGASTGPKTAAGIARQRAAVTIHGMCGQEARQEMRHFRQLLREMREDARRICEVV